MVQIEGLVNSDVYHDFLRAKVGCKQFVDILPEFEIMLKEDDEREENYKDLLLDILTEVTRSESHIKRNEKDDVSEDENDPQCELFFKSLKRCGNSYVLEKYDKDGVILGIEYERESSCDEEYDPQPRRKLRSAMKQKVGVSIEREIKNQMKLRNKAKNEVKSVKRSTNAKASNDRMESNNKANNEKVEKVNCSTNDRAGDEYHFVRKNRKIVDGNFACTYGGHTEVYFNYNEEHNQQKENGDDETSADVEILNTTRSEMNKKLMMGTGGPTKGSEYRQKVIAILRRPYDEDEYGRLWLDFEIRTPKRKHMELRNQRDRSCPTNRDGKSYLDYYPDLGRKLRQFQDDRPKCLNLLRGFFFWLQNSVQIGSFMPWEDAECLAVNPESC